MKNLRGCRWTAVLGFLALFQSAAWAQTPRWSDQKANDWYARQPWLVGSNYIPKSAINELEMWQEASLIRPRSTRNWDGPRRSG